MGCKLGRNLSTVFPSSHFTLLLAKANILGLQLYLFSEGHIIYNTVEMNVGETAASGTYLGSVQVCHAGLEAGPEPCQ